MHGETIKFTYDCFAIVNDTFKDGEFQQTLFLFQRVLILQVYDCCYYHHNHHFLLYARYPHSYSRDKQCPQGIHCYSYSVFVVYGASISSSCVGSFVLLRQHFPKYVCSAQYGCFLQLLNAMISWYLLLLLLLLLLYFCKEIVMQVRRQYSFFRV